MKSVAKQLTENFYLWERRGRGWQIANYPVEIEPPFAPFHHHYATMKPEIDDGRKPTLITKLFNALRDRKASAEGLEDVETKDSSRVDSPATLYTDQSPISELKVALGKEEKVSMEYVNQFLISASNTISPVSFEVVGTARHIDVQFACPRHDLPYVREELFAYFPAVVLSEHRNSLAGLFTNAPDRFVADFGLSEEFMRPLRTFDRLNPDPLTGLIGTLGSLGDDESAVLQILFQGARHPWVSSIIRSVSDGEGGCFFEDVPEMLDLARIKINQPLFASVIRVAIGSLSRNRSLELTRLIMNGLALLGEPMSNQLIPLSNDGYDDDAHLNDVILRRTRRVGMLLNCDELAALVHPPSPMINSGKLFSQIRKTKPAPSVIVGHNYVLGENSHQGKTTVVSLSAEARLRHVHVIGSTGTGKSTFLMNLILQDLRQGAGCAVLDPHGDLIDRILDCVPEERHEDVVLFDPADTECPVGFNVLEARSEIERTVVSSDLAALFRRFSTSWGDQMTTVLGNAVSALLECETGCTLLDLRRFLIEQDYRNDLLKSVHDDEVVYFWQKQFPLLRGAAVSSILTRLDIFLRPRTVRNIVGQTRGLDCATIMDSGKVLLMKLAHGIIGEENSYLLGSLLVSKLHQVAMARQARVASERRPFFVYIDEFQNFITPSMTAVLSGARKYGLGLVLAHQELQQLWNQDAQLASSLIANPMTRVCFRLGDFDAEKLQNGFSFFDAMDLQNLGVGEAIMRVERADNDFNLNAFPPPQAEVASAKSTREIVVALSRKKYGTFAGGKKEVRNEEAIMLSASTPTVAERVETTPRTHPKQIRVERHEDREPASDVKQREHRYLQTLIKNTAEQRGFRSVLEESTPSGDGRVDVGLERDGERIAVEVSVTTGDAHELQNIKKCLRGGYNKIIVCSPDKKNLGAIKRLVEQSLVPDELAKISLVDPADLVSFFDACIAKEITREERVKGYRVKLEYQSVSETDWKRKDDAVKKVIAQALQRMKK